MIDHALLDAAGRRRSPATMPGFHRGRPPRNKGLRYPADPPAVEEIVAVMRAAGDTTHGLRARALVVVLWRAGFSLLSIPWRHTDEHRDRGCPHGPHASGERRPALTGSRKAVAAFERRIERCLPSRHSGTEFASDQFPRLRSTDGLERRTRCA
jgi:hypothetical protein